MVEIGRTDEGRMGKESGVIVIMPITVQHLFEEMHVPPESILVDSILMHACQNLDYDLLLDMTESYRVDVDPEIPEGIGQEFVKRKSHN